MTAGERVAPIPRPRRPCSAERATMKRSDARHLRPHRRLLPVGADHAAAGAGRAAARRVRRARDAARGRAADQRHDGQRADPVSRARRRATSSRWWPRPPSRCSSQIAGIEHVMSVSRPGLAVITVQFKVGVPRTEALVRLYDTVNCQRRLAAAQAWACCSRIIKPKGIDDVPIVTLTLFSKNPATGAFDLERVAHSIEADLKRVPGTREVDTIGGPGRAVLVEIDPARMAGTGVTVAGPAHRAAVGQPRPAGGRTARRTIARCRRVRPVPPGRARRRPSWSSACATASRCSCATWPRVDDGPLPPSRYVWHGTAAGQGRRRRVSRPSRSPSPRSRARTPIDVADARDAARRRRCATP